MKKHRLFPGLILIALMALLLSVLASCGTEEVVEEPTEETVNPLTAGSYDAQGNLIQLAWYPDAKMNGLEDSLWESDGTFRYYRGSGYQTYTAIDVSSNQEEIDWETVKAAGVECAIIRVGYRTYGGGILTLDERCNWNLERAKEAGIKVGVYFFSQAVSTEEAEEEAQFVLDQLHRFELDLPVFYDTEEITYDSARTDSLTGEELTANALAFCRYIEKSGYTPGIYGSQMWICNKMDLMQLEQYKIWVAKYTEELNYPYELCAWQYSAEGRVDGISTIVDLDVIIEKK